MNKVSWYHAAAYCNWLSRKEGKPECYEPNSEGQYAVGMTIRADALQRVGYRLPTEAEWEYACRAGAGTSRYYGSSVDLLGRYAWNLAMATSPDRAQPCGRWLPNDLGLFDILGNVYEWCQDRVEKYHPDRNGTILDDIYMKEYINNPRLLRGGAFYYPPAYVRSAAVSGSGRRPGTAAAVSAPPGLTTEQFYIFTTAAIIYIYLHIIMYVRLPSEAGSDPKRRLRLPFWQSFIL